jgi:sarcosine oxidase, subunit beta
MSSNPEIIVVGAGVVGASLAFHLARHRAHVTVIDQGEVCAGMSARSGALIRMHYTFAPEVVLAWKSLEYFQNWNSIVGGECGFVRTGFALVAGADNSERVRNNVAMMQRLGVDVHLCDGFELRKLDPAFDTSDLALAASEPQSGYADPAATTRSFAAAAERHGARFVLRTAVSTMLIDRGRATGVEAVGGRRFIADAVCIAAGPWTDRLLAPAGVAIGIKSERAQIAFFRREPAMQHMACIDCISGSYFRPHGPELTLAGMGEWRPEPPADPDDFRENNDPEFVTEARRRLARRVPAMAAAEYIRGHAGIYDVSPDSRAVLGCVPGIDSLFAAAGFSGTGFKTAPAVGAAMAELILTGQSAIADISPFGFDRILSGRLIQTQNEYVMGTGFGHTL